MMKKLPLVLLCILTAFGLSAQISTFPYSESWEAGGTGSWTQSTSDDFDWTNNTGGTTSSSTGPTSASDGTNYLYTETSSPVNNGDIAIIENDFNFSSLSAPQLIFDYHMYFDGASNGGTLDVDVSTNGGTTWTNEWTKSGDQGNQWNAFEIVDLSSYGNQSSVKVRFHFTVGQNTSFQNDCAIDDIIVQQQPSCPRPLNLRAKTLQAFNAVIGWDTVAAATNGYEVIYGTSGFDPATGGTSLTTTTDSASLTGLSSATDYDFYLIADCGSSNGISDTAGPATFRTLCAGFSAPYTNNFDNGTDGQLANCWAQLNSYDNFAYARVETNPFGITPNSGSNVLEMYSYFGFSAGDTLAAITPQFTDLPAGKKQITFFAATGDATNDLYIGTTNSQNPGSPIDYLDTISFTATGTWQQVKVFLDSANGYNGTDEYIVLEHSKTGTFDDIWIDDFAYDTIPACPDPFRLVMTGSTDSSATISFNHPDSTFDYNWGPVGFTQGSPTSNFALGEDNPYTITGLAGNTSYDVYIKADCSASGNGQSGWVGPLTFTTQCSPFTAPYSQNFDGTTEPEVDQCWTTIDNTTASFSFIGTENFRNNSAPNSIELYNQSATTGDIILVSPAFSDLDTGKRIQFWVYDDDDDSDLLIGTMSDPTDASTFTNWQTISSNDMDDDSWELFVVDFSGYSGSDQHIAFKHGMQGSFDNIYIDDFLYEQIPPCQAPLANTLGTSSVAATNATVFWGSGGKGSETFVRWGSAGFDPNTSTGLGTDSVRGTDTTYRITGLSAQTTYDFYIQDSCGAKGLSGWTGPFTFTTGCLPLTAPYTENFDNTTIWSGTTLDPCWTAVPNGGFSHQWEANSGSTGSSSTGPSGDNTTGSGQYLYTETSPSSPLTATLTTPLVDVSSLNVPFFEFYYHRYGDDMGTLTVDINDGSGWSNLFTLVGEDQTASSDPWKDLGADISSYGDTVQVRFSSTDPSSFQADGAIDDVAFVEAPSCPNPAGLAANVTDTSAVLSWSSISNANDYEVWVGNDGFFQGTNTGGGFKTFTGGPDSLTVDTLTPNTTYEFLVRAVCGAGDSSAWVGPFSFTTNLPLPQPLNCSSGGPSPVFTEEFADNSAGWTGDIGTFGGNWEIPGTPTSSQTGPDNEYSGPPGSFASFETSGASNGQVGSMVSPAISLASGNSDAELSFWMYSYGSGMGTLRVGVSNSSSGPFTTVFTQVGQLQTAGNLSWVNIGADLSSYVGQTIYLEFEMTHGSGFRGDMAIDRVEVRTCVTCPRPSGITVSNLTANSAFVDWNAVSPATNGYDVIYGSPGFNPATGGTTLNASNDSITLTGLSSNTAYDCYLVSDCGAANGVSDTSGPVSFRTPCTPFTAPYTQNFDGTTEPNVDPCWTPIDNTGSSFSVVETESFRNVSSPNSLELYNYTATSGDVMIVSPTFSDLDSNKRIIFEVYDDDGSSDLEIGTMSDPNNPNTYTRFTTIPEANMQDDTWDQVRVSFSGYSGTDQYIVIKHGMQSSFDNFYIDDFVYEQIPDCEDPYAFNLTGVTDTSGTIDFTSQDTAFNYNWGPQGFTQGSPTSNFGSGNKPFTMTGLAANTCYDVYVQADCTADTNGFSNWAGPFTFCTACAPFTAPYSQNFDGTTAPELDNCWTPYVVGSSASVETESPSFGLQPLSAPNHLFLDNGSQFSNDTIMAVSPRFSDMTAGDKRVEFWVAAEFSSNNVDLLVGTMASPDDGSSLRIIDTVVVQGDDFYKKAVVNLDSANGYNGTHNYVALVHDNTNSFDGLFVDDFKYNTIPLCEGPTSTSLRTDGVFATTAVAAWGNGGDGDETFIRWGTTGFDPNATVGLGTDSVRGTDSTYQITGLSAQTTYDFYVQDSCAGLDLGNWIGPFTFTTACLPVTAPYTENFDNTNTWSGTTFDPCWSSSTTSGFRHQWEVESGSTGSSNTGPSGDNTTGSGQYLYTETSSSTPTLATLITPTIDVSGLNVPYFEFYYHRYGDPNDMGTLTIDINDGSGWSNLDSLVGPDQTSSGDPWKSLAFDISAYGDTVQIRFESTVNSTFQGDGAIDDFSIREAPTCPKVANLGASNISDSSFVASWDTSRGANSYELWLGPAGFFQGTNVSVGYKGITTADSLLVDTLSSKTCYDFVVRPICGPADTGAWAGPFSFCTQCSDFTARYTQNFDLTTEPDVDQCWNTINTTNEASSFIGTENFRANSAPNSIEMYNWTATTGDMILVSPRFSDLDNTKRVVFYTYDDDDGSDLIVGTMSDPTDETTFTSFQTITASDMDDDTWEKFTVDFTGYSGTDNYIAFKHGMNGSFDNIYIDDFVYENIPTCPVPTAFSTSNITANSIDLSWTAGTSSSNDFEVSYGAGITSAAPGTKQIVNASTSTTVSNLSSATNYCFFVREICGPADTSRWVGPICATTACTSFNIPYSENFDGTTWIPDNSGFSASASDIGACWSRDPDNGTDYSWRVRGTSTGSSSTGPNSDATGRNFVYTEASNGSSGDTAALISPLINLSSASNPIMVYGYYFYGSQIDRMLIEVNDGTGWTLESTRIGETQTSGTAPWAYDTIDLSAYTNSTVRVRFRGVSQGCCSGDMALDSVSFQGTVSCPSPSNLTASNTGCDSVELDWTSSTGGSIIQWGPANFTPGQGNFTGVVTSRHTISGLSPGTDYDFWVADTCTGDTSGFTGPLKVTTSTSPQPVAVINMVADTIIGANKLFFFDGSGSQNATSYSWDFGNGLTGNMPMDTTSYAVNGQYTVTLIVSNACGSDTATMNIMVDIGLEENPIARSLNIFPNPTSGSVNIEFEVPTSAEAFIRILDMRGRVIMQRREGNLNGSYREQWDVSSLAKGMYMIEIESGDMKAERRLSIR